MSRRAVIRVALFLLLGAVVNIAAAWVCALTIGLHTAQRTRDVQTSPEEIHNVLVTRRFATEQVYDQRIKTGSAPSQQTYSPETGPDALIPAWSGFSKPSPTYVGASAPFAETRGAEARGWPMLSMRWDWHVRSDETPAHFGSPPMHVVGGIKISRSPDGSRPAWMIPLRPIWPNFAINTLFYALLLWVIFCGPFALRQRRRIKRGLCPACAYPVGASDVCTECGRPLPKRARTAS